jgi:hypothetical protein
LKLRVIFLKTGGWFGCSDTEQNETRHFTLRAEHRLGNKEINGITRLRGDETRREGRNLREEGTYIAVCVLRNALEVSQSRRIA